MNKILFSLILSAFLLLGVSQAKAEVGVSAYTGTDYREQQVFTYVYNNSGSELTYNSVVILDTSATAGSTLGAYFTTTTTADSPYVFGVTDQTIKSGEVGRVCVRGPHTVRLTTESGLAAGDIVATSGTAGKAVEYSTSDGTVGGYLGTAIVDNTTTFEDRWWIIVNPQTHK